MAKCAYCLKIQGCKHWKVVELLTARAEKAEAEVARLKGRERRKPGKAKKAKTLGELYDAEIARQKGEVK
jgi:hypothetical protein